MDWGMVTTLVLSFVSLLLVFVSYSLHKRKVSVRLSTLSHLPPKTRRLVRFGLVLSALLITLLILKFGVW